MDVEELLSRTWSAVEKAGVPPELQELAFKEAISFLREGSAAPNAGAAVQKSAPAGGAGKPAETSSGTDASDFFARLAHESGVSETELSDVLSLVDGQVRVTPATRTLGTSKTEQAKNVIALVAS